MPVLIFSHLRSRRRLDKSCLWRDKPISIQRPWPSSGRFFTTFIGLFWFGALTLRAANYYVATNGIDGTGLDWGHAASNIQYAVDLAIGEGDTVWVSNGSYRVTNQVTITNKITVRSANGWTNTTVFADFPTWTNTRCFFVSRTGTVDGFTITNGHYMATDDYCGGGGAYLSNGTIRNCYFTRNVCSNGEYGTGGGGVFINVGTVSNCIFVTNISDLAGVGREGSGGGAIFMYRDATVIGCYITSNANVYSGRGGGIHIYNSGTMLVSNCTFNNNVSATYGSAIYLAGGTMANCVITNHTVGYEVIRNYGTMRNCVVVNNKATSGSTIYSGYLYNCTIANNEAASGGEYVFGGGVGIPALVDGCIISNNICRQWAGGGGVAIKAGGIVRNCLIHHNTNMSAAGNGGGVLLTNVANTAGGGIYNCTIVNNYSTNGGGGIAVMGTNNYIANCIIAGNNAHSNTYAEIYNVNENTNNYWYCCANPTSAPLAVGQGNITNDPAFSGVSNWRLTANSPCINKGTNISWMTNSYDLDVQTRLRYGVVDMGAYERIYDGTIYGFQ